MRAEHLSRRGHSGHCLAGLAYVPVGYSYGWLITGEFSALGQDAGRHFGHWKLSNADFHAANLAPSAS